MDWNIVLYHIIVRLGKHEPKGVEIAHHFDDLEDLQDDLVPALLRKLDYPQNWMETEE